MSKDKATDTTNPPPASKPPANHEFKRPVALPKAAVLIQKVAGQVGTHPKFGLVVIGSVVTTSVNAAVEWVTGPAAEFAPFREEDATQITKHLADQETEAGKDK